MTYREDSFDTLAFASEGVLKFQGINVLEILLARERNDVRKEESNWKIRVTRGVGNGGYYSRARARDRAVDR